MNPSDFLSTAPGHLIPTRRGHLAYLPTPLPPAGLRLDSGILGLLCDIERAMRELERLSSLAAAGAPGLIAVMARREAVWSTQSRATDEAMRRLLLRPSRSLRVKAEGAEEVECYLSALGFGAAEIKAGARLDLRLIQELHRRTVVRTRRGESPPGELRRGNMHIGDPALSIEHARFIPPPAALVRDCLIDFERYLLAPDQLPLPVRLALVHIQFETIHPFSEANGRVGRMMMPLMLMQEGVLSQPTLCLSRYFHRHRAPYADGMLRLRQTGYWGEWITFFLQGVLNTALESASCLQRLMSMREEYLREFGETAGLLFEFQALTAGDLRMSARRARRALDDLAARGGLQETGRDQEGDWLKPLRRSGAGRERIYVATEVAGLLDEPAEQRATAETHVRRGIDYYESGRVEEAIRWFRRATIVDPENKHSHNDLGVALFKLDRCNESIASYRFALRLDPEFAEAYNNLGNVYWRQGQVDEALALYERSIELKPDFADAHNSLALTLLLKGDFERGWREHEWRWESTQFIRGKPRVPQPSWDGSDLQGRTIALYAEQGFGDTLQFVRYIPLVAARAGRVILVCQRELAPLLESFDGVDQLVIRGQALPQFDVHAPLMSLPYLLGHRSEAEIPARVPYLRPPRQHAARWASVLPASDSFRVGLAWAGNPRNPKDRFRSLRLADFGPLADVPGVEFFGLQKEAAEDAAPPGGMVFTNIGPKLGEFADTAAAMGQLDLVLSVDTAAAHLAGALGRPVWILLPYVPDWRWQLGREDSPWYPTARLFRQHRLDDWSAALELVRQALPDAVRNRAARRQHGARALAGATSS